MVTAMLRAAALLAAMSWTAGPAAAQEIEGLHGPAAETISAELRRTGFLTPMRVHLFYGDLTGRRTNDAVALIYHPTGGNSEYLTEWLLWDRDGRYELVEASPLEAIVGDEPRDVTFSPGRFQVTMTVMNPGDPRCCPTGRQTFSVALGEAAPGGAPTGQWSARRSEQPEGIEIEAVSDDGRSRMTGRCATGAAEPGFWLTISHDGDALDRIDGKNELFRLEVAGRSGARDFTAGTRYDAAAGSWVADRPLGDDFLSAFAAGAEMTANKGSDGAMLARFALRGTADAVRMMREVCGPAVAAAPSLPVTLPFLDGRYLSDASLCGLTDGGIVERIGDEIHYVLLVIEDGNVNGAESICEVRDVARSGDLVRMNAECAMEGMVNETTIEMTYVSDEAFRSGERLFERCD